ncbi:GlsB/YeaQ/YmgE family stress response membrane protein [Kordiimonas marina]|uniref:GlsB/YeaQ/YmgE family stress response membrane protein n=1 Tax=Kordiimonas marina TaxID=2872312 RepID=UPI001FF65A76|nr:GlsB/YeaQ/YmgE family stress response membrane protein [Kordiimonas marina]MCJ9428600.1 GlsB/YeaQ/YmgE family stress response membrane protein [Kordiimonas marina]
MLWTILIGAVAGFLAGHILRGEGFGAIGNIVLGILGGIVGKLLFGVLGLGPTGMIGQIIAGVVGAVILVLVFGSTKARRHRRHLND